MRNVPISALMCIFVALAVLNNAPAADSVLALVGQLSVVFGALIGGIAIGLLLRAPD